MFGSGNMTRQIAARRRTSRAMSYQQRARQQVAKCLAASGLTQTALGDQLRPRRRPAWVSRYLRGEIDADVDTLQQFAGIFQCSLDQLFGTALPDDNGHQSKADLQQTRLLAAFATMTDARRQLLIAMAESLAEPLVAPRRGPAT